MHSQENFRSLGFSSDSQENLRSVSAGESHLQVVQVGEVTQIVGGLHGGHGGVHRAPPLNHGDVLHGVTHGQGPGRGTTLVPLMTSTGSDSISVVTSDVNRFLCSFCSDTLRPSVLPIKVSE